MFDDTNLTFHGFLRAADGTFTVLVAPSADTGTNSGTIAFSANADATVAGIMQVASPGAAHSFLRTSNGTYTVFDPTITGVLYSWAFSINDNGAVVGSYTDGKTSHGYLRTADGTFVILDAPNAAAPGGTGAERINAAGAVIGFYADPQNVTHGFVYQ